MAPIWSGIIPSFIIDQSLFYYKYFPIWSLVQFDFSCPQLLIVCHQDDVEYEPCDYCQCAYCVASIHVLCSDLLCYPIARLDPHSLPDVDSRDVTPDVFGSERFGSVRPPRFHIGYCAWRLTAYIPQWGVDRVLFLPSGIQTFYSNDSLVLTSLLAYSFGSYILYLAFSLRLHITCLFNFTDQKWRIFMQELPVVTWFSLGPHSQYKCGVGGRDSYPR